VWLVHWGPREAKKRVEELSRVGVDALWKEIRGGGFLKELETSGVEAVIIDLTRLPTQGRDVAIAVRTRKATRGIPLVFLSDEVEQEDRLDMARKALPDAVFCSWGAAREAVETAIHAPPKDPIVPSSNLAGYSGTPLPKKLGIKAGTQVALVGAPPYFSKVLGDLPEGARLESGIHGAPGLVIWFPRGLGELQRDVRRLAARLSGAPMWVAWPKKASGADSDLSEQAVRRAGLDAGLVDYKICAIDATWSGLLFTARKSKLGTG
jgi:CheY-like chemotaxis protein